MTLPMRILFAAPVLLLPILGLGLALPCQMGLLFGLAALIWGVPMLSKDF